MKKEIINENEGFEISSRTLSPIDTIIEKLFSKENRYSNNDIKNKIEIDLNCGLFQPQNHAYMSFLLETIISDNIEVEFKKVNYSSKELFNINNTFFSELSHDYKNILVKLNKKLIKPYVISKSKNMVDACDYSKLTKIPNVYVRNDSTILTPIKLVHETQHQINYIINDLSDKTHLKEAPSIFSEMLLTEKLYLESSDKEYLKAYLFRASEVFKNIKQLKNYLNFLVFIQNKEQINYRHSLKSFNLTEEDLMDINMLKIIYYILSFLTAHSIYDEYDNDKTSGLNYLNSVIDGTIMNNSVNFNDGYEKGLVSFEKRYTKIMKCFK